MATSTSNALRFIVPGLLALAIVSCGHGDSGGPSGTFSVAAPTTLTVQAGSSATVQVAVTRTGGFSGTVTLDLTAHPEALTHSFAPAVVPGASSTATLTVTVDATVAPGTYTIKLSGKASGLSEQAVLIVLTVTPAPTGGFTLSLDPASLSIMQGQGGTATITLSRTAPFTGPVALQILIAPPGVTRTFDPAVIPAGGSSSTLTIAVAADAVPGAYPLVVSGSATGVSPQEVQLLLTVTWFPGDFTLAVAPEALSVEQTKSGEVNLTIERTAPYEGPVDLTLQGTLSNVTGTFVPASIPAGAKTATLTLSPALTAVPGVYAVFIRAAGGWRVRTAVVALTITLTPGFTLQAGSVGVPQGRVGGAGIRVFRQGGFTGAVNLALEGALPAGVTAVLVSPTIPAGEELNAITFTMLATAPVGIYHINLHGTASGVPDHVLDVLFEVRAAPSGNVTFTFCNSSETPIWFGYQNGAEQWTQVAASGGVVSFPITSGKGGVAWVTPWENGTGFYVGMFLGTQAELVELGSLWCQHTPTRKNLTGTVANVGSDWYNVSMGDASAEIHGGTGLNYQLSDVPVGLFDLVASKTTIPVGATSSTMIIRRGINYPAGGVIPLLDFASGEAFLTTTMNATVENLGAEVFKFTQAYVTAGGTIGLLAHRDPQVLTTPYMVVPAAQAQPGDLYNVKVESSWQQDGTVNRMVINSFAVPNDQTLTLGPALTPPSVFTLQAAPLYQVRVISTWQAEYGDLFNGSFMQNTRDGEFYATRGYLGNGGTIDVTTPDLRAVPGWNATWGPVSGATTVLRGMAYGWTGTTGALFPGFLGEFVTTPNVTVRTAALATVATP